MSICGLGGEGGLRRCRPFRTWPEGRGERLSNGCESLMRDQAELARPGESFGAVSGAELAVDVACVALDGAHRDGIDPQPPPSWSCPLRGGSAPLELTLAQGIFEPGGSSHVGDCRLRDRGDVRSPPGNACLRRSPRE